MRTPPCRGLADGAAAADFRIIPGEGDGDDGEGDDDGRRTEPTEVAEGGGERVLPLEPDEVLSGT